MEFLLNHTRDDRSRKKNNKRSVIESSRFKSLSFQCNKNLFMVSPPIYYTLQYYPFAASRITINSVHCACVCVWAIYCRALFYCNVSSSSLHACLSVHWAVRECAFSMEKKYNFISFDNGRMSFGVAYHRRCRCSRHKSNNIHHKIECHVNIIVFEEQMP